MSSGQANGGTNSTSHVATPPPILNRERGAKPGLRDADKRARTLSMILQALAGGVELDSALQRVAELLVADLCDWCTIDMQSEDWIYRRVAVAYGDPSLKSVAVALREAFNSVDEVPLGLGRPPRALRFAVCSPAAEVSAKNETNGSHDAHDAHGDARARVLRAAQAALIVPIVSREKVIGAITCVGTDQTKVFSAVEIAFLEDISRIAAIAIENAVLRANAARERSRAELLSLQKNEFLGVVSHELRTPLQAMLGWTQLLMENKLQGIAAARALEALERNVKAQAQIVEDVLDVSRIGRGLLQLDIAPVDLKVIVQDAISSLRFTAQARKIEVRFSYEPAPAIIDGDATWLQRVVWNLLSNAIKFTPEGGKVSIEMASNESHAVIRVKDTGKGIPSDFLPHIFDGLRQYDGGTTRRYGGLGIGLTIARHITEAHGGTVDADSKGENMGATFTVTLPVAARRSVVQAQAPASELNERQATPKPTLNGMRALLVEDDAETRELLGIVLEQAGAVVTLSKSAKEALQAIQHGKYDVIISDIAMEGEDGYSLIRQIRTLESEPGGRTPALALTAFARSEDRIRALAAGFQMHIPKPVEPDELILAVSTLAAR